MKSAILLLSTIVFVLTACQPKEEPVTRESLLSQGFTMMDEGHFDEAIIYFSDMLKNDNHYHVKIALASAYAGRAGIKLQEIYSFVVVKDVPVPALQLKGVSLDKQASEAVKSLGEAAQHWIQIPSVGEEGRDDLLGGLDALKGDQEPGARLYAAVLRIVVLKSAIEEGVANFEKLAMKAAGKKMCAQDLVPYTDWAQEIVRGLSYLAMDLEIAFPNEKTQYQDIRLKAESAILQLKTIKAPAGENKCL